MNALITKSALASAIALSIAACSPAGSGGIAGIGGSGYVSSGSVTGFGSVFVNGVEFETDSATFDVDGESGTQDDLAIGMVVRVDGTINDDGITGIATNITFDDQIQGPVTGLTLNTDGITQSFTVLGITVIIDSGSTTFDLSGKNNIPANTVFNFDTIADNNVVEISGFFDSNGDLNATRVELKNLVFDVNSIIEIRGTITGLSGTTFTIGGLTVDASSAALDDLANGLENGVLVEVKGTLDLAKTTLTASKVEAEENSVDDTDEFELEGIITDYVDNSNFKIGDISVDASNATFEPATISLTNDLRIEAEGAIVNGVLLATEVKLEGGDLKVNAKVTSVNTANNTFEVTPNPVLSNQTITISVTTSTQLEDDVNEIEPFTLNNLVANTDFVEIRGYDDGNGGITANEVDVKKAEDVILQGVIQTGSDLTTSGFVKVLGVDFTIQNPGQTDFEDANGTTMLPADFFNAISLDSTIIKIKDKDEDGVADEISLQTP